VFPDIFAPYVGASMLGIAQERGALTFAAHDLRRWALPGVHRAVDDAPYGGGAGMVMRPEPYFAAVRAVSALDARKPLVVLMSPQGEPFTQETAERLAGEERLLMMCGRYEGFDERIRSFVDEELSLGDFVMTGGEVAAMAIIEATVRLIPGVLGNEDSTREESHSEGLLEYPQYTRPVEFRGQQVPEVLASGNHAHIARWRAAQAVERTRERRPDLLAGAPKGEGKAGG
jgi:tRNA (guanine37-N1)-methyltransferase